MSLTGPSIEARNGKADSLVILLHGYGADGNDLIGLAPLWQAALPATAFISPNAPERCEMGGSGYQWFGIGARGLEDLAAGVLRAAPVLDAFIDEQLALRGLDESRLALVGFSQGTIMSLHVGLRRKLQLAGIVGFSGALMGAELLSETSLRPPILLVHGDADPVLPVAQMHSAVAALSGAGFAVKSHVSRGVGHGIDQAGIDLAGQFLREMLISSN
jgi:phospholipase/carboxylesterase